MSKKDIKLSTGVIRMTKTSPWPGRLQSKREKFIFKVVKNSRALKTSGQRYKIIRQCFKNISLIF